MRSDQQCGSTGSGDSGFGCAPLRGPAFSGRRPWFGPGFLGYVCRPQTWQGWLLLAVLVALLITANIVAPRSPLLVVGALAALIVVPLAVKVAQRPR